MGPTLPPPLAHHKNPQHAGHTKLMKLPTGLDVIRDEAADDQAGRSRVCRTSDERVILRGEAEEASKPGRHHGTDEWYAAPQ